jgi:hypothetical protein
MENTIISSYLLCSGGIHGTSSASNTMENIIISLYVNVPEVFMVPPAPQVRWKTR